MVENNVPKHLQELLGLAGVFTVEDLLEVDGDFLLSIEEDVRNSRYNDQVDLDSKKNRIRYFGTEMSNLEVFSFRPLERKKLMKLAELAKEELQKRTKAK